MLVLTRKPDQCIRIGKDVLIRVVAIQGNRVRLAFDAPRDVAVLREEVVEKERSLPKEIEITV